MTKAKDLEESIENAPIHTNPQVNEAVLRDLIETLDEVTRQESPIPEPSAWRIIVGSRVGSLAAAFLIVAFLVAVLIQTKRVEDLSHELERARSDIAIARTDDSATINLYLGEHQDVVARNASLNSAIAQPVQMHINQDDILYYEFLDDGPEFMRPGIIVRGPLSQRQINPPEAPTISNGHTLTLSEAREAANFNLISPPWFRPCYKLDQIRKIEGRDALQLLYTDGINSVSLFEQPLDGQRGLEPKDFREYAVYRNKGQVGGTILAWKDDVRSYVLIGNIEMSQLMNMAQSITAGK